MFHEKKVIRQDPSQWVVVPDTHEPIISRDIYEKVQAINTQSANDYKRSWGKFDSYAKSENIFLRTIICGECGMGLNRKAIPKAKNRMSYNFYCNFSKKHNDGSVFISGERLVSIIEAELKNRLAVFVDFQSLVEQMKQSPETKAKVGSLDKNIILTKQNITKKETLLKSLYEDLKDGILSEDEYGFAKERYLEEHRLLMQKLAELLSERETFEDGYISNNHYSQALLSLKDRFTLTRAVVELLIEKITVYADKSIEIRYKFSDDYQSLRSFAGANGVTMP
jgi:hypothetical protein